MAIRLRRGLNADRTTITPEPGEPLWTTDTKKLYIGDGSTAGGNLISGGGTVTSVATAGLISGGTITGTGTITTSMSTGKLVGRSTAGTGIMEEISIGTGLTLSSGILSNSATYTSPLTTKGDIFVRNSTVDTRLPIGLDTQVLIADSTQTTGIKWGSNTAATPTGYYGAWKDDFTQTAAVDNTGYAMKFHTADITPNGISIVNNGSGDPTRITFANTGIYNIQFSSQFQNADNAQHDVNIWLRLNGSDVAGSNGLVSIPARKAVGAGNEGHVITGWNYVLSVVAGQYYELYWMTSNHTYVTMQYYAAGSPPPSAASVILTVTQQSGIMAGTGITAINSLTGAAQTLSVGTSGTDFAISSTGSTHAFNLPTASASNRGLLSTADWTAFSGKESALTFSAPLSRATNTISIPAATTSVDGYLTAANWTTFNGKQNALTLTTTGTSGAATLVGSTLNIPQYSGGGGGSQKLETIIAWDGNGSFISGTNTRYAVLSNGGTISGWSIVAIGTSPTCTIDIVYIGPGGTALPNTSICASALPSLSVGNSIYSTTLTGWTTAIAAGGTLGFRIAASSNVLQLKITLIYS